MGGNEGVVAGEAVDAGRVFEVGHGRVLVAFTETHQRLVRPWILVEDRDFHDTGADDRVRLLRIALDGLDLAQDVVGRNDIGIELHLEGGVRRTDLGYTGDPAFADRRRHRQAFEESLERHAFVALDEQVFVTPERVSVHRATSLLPCADAKAV